MTKQLLVFAAIVVFVVADTCAVNPNTLPEVSGDVMHLLQETANGQKFVIGDIASKDRLFVAKLKGTPYEMGKAFGQMFKEDLPKQLQSFFAFYGDLYEKFIKSKLPKWMTSVVGLKPSTSLLRSLLDLNVLVTKKYTNPRYYEQIQGIADGAGINGQDIKRMNIFSEFVKASCTVIGLWGPATAEGNTLHLRALDWDKSNPINQFPVAIVYQPSGEGLHTHVNVAYLGFVGSLTGISDKITLGEKVWKHPKGSMPTTRYGNPWMYVFRDLMYESHDLKSAIAFLNNTHRTCAIHIGLGSVEDHSFRMIEYSYKVLNVYDDKNYNHYTKNHPQRNGVAYWDKHVQPSDDACVGDLLTNSTYYGKWDAETLWRVVGLSHRTGDSQLVVFDLENQRMFVAYSEMGTSLEAYARRPISVDLRQLMSRF